MSCVNHGHAKQTDGRGRECTVIVQAGWCQLFQYLLNRSARKAEYAVIASSQRAFPLLL